MRLRHLCAFVCTFSAIGSGCSATYTTAGAGARRASDASRNAARQPVEKTRWSHLFLFAMVGAADVDVRDVCDGNVATRIENEGSFLTTSLTILSLGLYAPIEHRITCAAPITDAKRQ